MRDQALALVEEFAGEIRTPGELEGLAAGLELNPLAYDEGPEAALQMAEALRALAEEWRCDGVGGRPH